MDDKLDKMKQGERGAWISIIAYLILSILKLVVGYASDSKALFADGLNNSTDIVASVAVLIGLRIARKPADDDHKYGHYRAETVATFIAALIMAGVSINVLWDAVQSMIDRNFVVPDPISMWVALFSAGVMLIVGTYNGRLGKRINSQAVLAAAADNRSDAFVSIGAFVGILGAQFGWHWLDPIAAVLVGLIILKTAYQIFREAVHALTDGFDEAHLKVLEDMILGVPQVHSIVDIKARTYGSNVYVDAVIGVDERLTVGESHDITEQIEKLLFDKEKIEYVHIHVEPVDVSTEKKGHR
ncbi:cation diffusion facilitator family transporter [Tumebacillus lipolyticus]|uniref:Cation diffusion facilitator family transporter n=1 Tax=Tumebacillus lipolyticus TaxID=1280370 RepID=A0ABW4ZUL7_9BACL